METKRVLKRLGRTDSASFDAGFSSDLGLHSVITTIGCLSSQGIPFQFIQPGLSLACRLSVS